MAQTIKLKRSATAGNTPTTSQLALGELGINTTDGKLFLKKSVSGTESIVDVGGLPLTGGTLTGNLSLGDNVKAQFGASDDLEIFSNGSTALLKAGNATSDIRIESDNRIVIADRGFNEAFAVFNDDSDVKLYHDGSQKLATTSTGVDVTGVITTDGMTTSADIAFGDGDKALFGASDDLQIYHDGNNSIISDVGTGHLNLRGTNTYLQNSDGTANYLVAIQGDETKLYFNNSAKIATTATGADISGVLTADGLTVDGGTASPTHLFTGARGGTLVSIDNESTSTSYGLLTNTASVSANSYPLWVTSNDVNRLTVGGNGDISFYDSSGSSQNFFWDSSASYLGLGTTTVNADLHISKTSGAKLWLTAQGNNPSDAGSLRFAELNNGNNYFEFKHDGSSNTLSLNSTNGNLVTFNRSNQSTSFSGSVTADGLVVDTGANSFNALQIKASSATGGTYGLGIGSSSDFTIYANGTSKNLIRATAFGDISFYDSSANQGLFWDSSTSRLGLGVTNPSRLLHLQSNGPDAYLRLNSTGNESNAFMEFGTDDTTWTVGAKSNESFVFNNGTERLTINADGSSVFSGRTTSANSTVGSGTASTYVDLTVNGASTSNYGPMIELQSAGTAFGKISNVGRIQGGTSTDMFVTTASTNSLVLGTNNTPRVTINSSGNATFTGDVVASRLKTEGTEPTLFFNDTTTGHDDWKMYADWDQFQIQQYVNDSTWTSRLHFAANGNATFSGSVTSTGLPLNVNTSMYSTDHSLSYYGSTNGVYLNGAGNSGWLRLNASGVTNDSVSHNLFGINAGNLQTFKTNSTLAMQIDASQNVNIPNGGLMVGATTAPDRKLHVKDSNYRVAVFERTGSANSYIVLKDPNTTTDVGIGATTNDLKFRSGNSDNMSLSSSGNLNIPNGGLMVGSTTAPTARLHLKSASRGSFALRVTDSDTTNDILRSGSQADGDGFLQLRTVGGAGNVLFDASGDSYINGGNLGVGCSPVTLKSSTTLQVSGNAKLGDDNGRGLLSLGDINSTGANVGIWRGAAGAYAGVGNYLNLGGYDGITFTTGASEIASQTERMRIDSSGRVGIGTATIGGSSTTKLHLMSATTSSPTVANDADELIIEGAGSSGMTFLSTSSSNIRFGDATDSSVGQISYTHSDNSLMFGANNAERMRIDSSGNVGIGTSSPNAITNYTGLTLNNATYGGFIDIENNGTHTFRVISNTTASYIGTIESDPLVFNTADTERTRIASNGTLYHGKTADSLNTGGLQTLISGQTSITQSYTEPLRLNRMSSEGAIQKFYYNGGEVGSIGTANGDLHIDGGASHSGIRFQQGSLLPRLNGADTDGTIDLGYDDGSATHRFKDLYLSNNATAQKLTLTKAPVGLFTIEVDGTNTGQPNLIVKKSTSEALRIDNNKNLLIGTTSTTPAFSTSSGVNISPVGESMISGGNNTTLFLNRTTGDGNIIDLRKDGTTVGSIGASGGDLVIGTGDTGIHFHDGVDSFIPWNVSTASYRDAAIDLGTSSYRYKNLYLSGGVIGGGAIRSFAGTAASPAFRPDNDLNCGIFFPAANTFAVTADGSEAYRVDPFGNLLVGKTSLDFGATSGQEFRADGRVFIGHSGAGHFVNRIGSDGAISEFRKDGTTVGSIQSRAGIVSTIVLDPRSGQGAGLTGAGAGGDTLRHITPTNESGVEVNGKVSLGNSINGFKDLHLSGKIYGSTLGIGDAGIQADQYSNAVKPFRPDITSGTSDNYLDLGTSSVRWVDIYATNGTIQTSDRNEKQDIEDLTEAEERVAVAAKGLLKKFRWKSAVEDKGDDARIHFGIIAQDLQDAFEAEGLDAGRYGMFTSNTWTDEDGEEQTRMGVRYSELLAFIISAI